MKLFDNAETLGTLKRKNGKAVRVSKLENGSADIRVYYRDNDDLLKPSTKGIVLHADEVTAVIELLKGV